MARYLLNSAVITAPGSWEYYASTAEPGSPWQYTEDEARAWLQAGPFVSTIGYPETAAAMAELFGVEIPVDRRTIRMAPGDEALVFRLVFPQGVRPDPSQKGRMGLEFIRQHCEIGLLRRR